MNARQIVLAERPQGMPTQETFRFEETEVKPPQDGEVLVEPLYISVDPYMRGRMSTAESYVPPYELDQPIVGGIVAEVIGSNSPTFSKGDKVLGRLPWATKIVSSADELRKLDDSIPLSYYLGIAGMTGMTAYFGINDICQPQKGETLVVSGAAGAVGSVAGQIAKLNGARVVGIAGTDEKVQSLKDKYGFDAGINYKTTKDLSSAVKETCPDGVDAYYDNVGGEITDAVFEHINQYARVAVCGQIALYNKPNPVGPRILSKILKKSVYVQGFLVKDYSDRFAEASQQLSEWIKADKLEFTETVMKGFDQVPDAFLGLFEGRNKGKMIVKVDS